jgi:branched-chain amino acid transport system ATP-binding protein
MPTSDRLSQLRGSLPALQVRGLNLYYGHSHALQGVDLTLQDGVLSVVGRNGMGKTSLCKAIMGLVPASTGSVSAFGEELIGRSTTDIARLGIGYVPQGRGLFAGMSVEQNLELGGLKRQTGNGVHWTRERIYEYFPRIKERLDSPADYLSGGEQQMVAVARALSGDVRVLLLDEPFEGLAPTVVEQLFETFDRLRKEIAIIIVDHHLDLALALSDTTVALERGRVIHQGPSKALRDDLDLRRKVLWL